MVNIRKDVWFFISIISVILIDQLTKWLIRIKFTVGQSAIIIKDFLSIIIALLIYYYHKNHESEEIPRPFFILIMGGAIGNLIDRIFLTYVTDFINFSFWPAFNLADTAITLGTIGLILFYIKRNE